MTCGLLFVMNLFVEQWRVIRIQDFRVTYKLLVKGTRRLLLRMVLVILAFIGSFNLNNHRFSF